jgi:hypothetical protein
MKNDVSKMTLLVALYIVFITVCAYIMLNTNCLPCVR